MQYVATDGSLIYFADTGTGWPGSSTLVIAVDAQTHTQYRFPAGVTVSNCGNPLNGVIDIAPNGSNTPATGVPFVPSGIAVQTQGNLLAVAHGMADLPPGDVATSNNRNMIELFDKVSGRLLSTININNPRRIAFAPNGDLWVISGAKVVRISAVGNQNVVASALQGVSVPLSIAVDPTTSDVLVADGGEVQQVKRFSSAGNLISTFGDLGGYTDCSPKVTKTRLFLDSTAGPGYPPDSEYGSTAFLAVQPDSSFWIGDPGNARVLHISSQGQYIEEISFLRFLYNIARSSGTHPVFLLMP